MTIAHALACFPLRTELEYIAEQAASRPRTIADIELDLLRAHSAAIHDERRIREYLAIRRGMQKRDGMVTYGYGKQGGASARFYYRIQGYIRSLRAERAKIAELNAEVERIETTA